MRALLAVIVATLAGCAAEYTHIGAQSPGPRLATAPSPQHPCIEQLLPESQRKAHARLAFRRGMESIKAGDPRAGIADLQRAYCILPHPNVAFNIGRAYGEAGDYDRAITWLRRYLESGPPDAYDVESMIYELERRRCVDAKKSLLALDRAGEKDGVCVHSVHPWPPPELR